MATILKVSQRSIWRLVAAGQLVAPLRIGGSIRWRHDTIDIAGNLANSLEQSTLNVMLGDQQQGTRIVLLKKLDRMRAEFGWNESPKLERILIERVCQTWLYLHWLEMADTQSKNRSIDLVKHESEKIERAERRHLRAVKMLATIHKMALPLRIDIKAEVNVSEQKTSVGSASRFDLLDLVN